MTDLSADVLSSDFAEAKSASDDRPSNAAVWPYTEPLQARRTWGWAVPIALFVLFAAGSMLFVVPAILMTRGLGLGALLPDSFQVTGSQLQVASSMGLLVLLYTGILIVTYAWVRWIERRNLASIGFCGPGWRLRYLRGLSIGIVIVILLDFLRGGLVELDHPGEGGAYLLWAVSNLDFSFLLDPLTGLGFLLLALVFFYQSFAEEVLFRGWMMSALAARWGLVAAVLVNMVVFGLLHAQHYAAGWGIGSVTILGLTLVGGFLSLLAISERSIAGASGVHGGFNASIILFYTIANFAENPDIGLSAATAETLEVASNGVVPANESLAWFHWGQAILFAVLMLYVLYRLKTRRKIPKHHAV
jgi:membrane protease YdiL (CAAX protease family)